MIDRQPGRVTIEKLRSAATDAMRNAHAPYSSFRVGAALLGDDGTVIAGCNVENASFGATICAERGAVAAAVARGITSFDAILIVTEAAEPTPPCGVCRQVLVEFAPGMHVVSVTSGGREASWSLSELLPQPFIPDSLGRT